MLSTISHIKSVNSVERKMSVLLELIHLRNVCMSIQHVPLTFYYKKATRIAHVTWASRKLRSQSKSTLGRCGEKPFFNKNNFFQKLNTFWNSFLTIFKVLQLGFTQSFQVQIGHRLHEHGNTATCQFGYLKKVIIYHIWWVKTPIRHGKLLASPVMLKDIKLLFQLVSLLDALSFLGFLRIKFTMKPSMYISMTAIHCTYKAELKSYLQSLNNTVQV